MLGPAGDAPDEGQAGTEPGEELYEVWLDMDDVEELLFSELELPRLKPKSDADAEAAADGLRRHRAQRARSSTRRPRCARTSCATPSVGRASLGGIEKPDLRYLSYREVPKPRNRAVIFLAMDVSGSMNVDRKRMARLFFYWCVQFLRSRYEQTEIVFVAHTTEAREVTEEEFFSRVESGGTKVSSAFEVIEQIHRERYPADDWNVYVLHVSDGDNFGADNHAYARADPTVDRGLLAGRLPGSRSQRRSAGRTSSPRSTSRRRADLDGFVFADATDDRELWPALKKFFVKDDVEAAIR